jgi:hypothetical protein
LPRRAVSRYDPFDKGASVRALSSNLHIACAI